MRVTTLPRGPGARVDDISFKEPLDASVAARIHKALLDRHFVLHQGEVLPAEDQLRLTAVLGEPITEAGGRESVDISYESSMKSFFSYWHCDMFGTPPAFLSIMHVLVGGGETSFLDGYEAFERMPADLKTEVERAQAIYGSAVSRRIPTPRIARWETGPYPLAWAHPVTGRKALHLNLNFTTSIVGRTESQTAELLARLDAHLQHLSTVEGLHQVIETKAGNTIIVDNRSTLHHGPKRPELYPGRRLRRTCTRPPGGHSGATGSKGLIAR